MSQSLKCNWTHSNHFLGTTHGHCYLVDTKIGKQSTITASEMPQVERSRDKRFTFLRFRNKVMCLSGPESKVLWTRAYRPN